MSDTSTSQGERRQIGSYETYEEAQRVLDKLADAGFAVDHATVVGRDLRLVERVLGRASAGRAALTGAASGAWFGLFVGLLFWIVTPWALGAVAWGVLVGAVFGACWGLVMHAIDGGKVESLRMLEAARYDLLVDEDHAEEALRALGRTAPASEGRGRTAPASEAPPRQPPAS
jgi:hypothetical protein